MSDQYKTKSIADGPFIATRPALGILAGGAPVLRSTLHTVARSADSVVTSGRRTLCTAHGWGASTGPLEIDTDPDSVAHDYPYAGGLERTAWVMLGHLAPGSACDVYAVAYPSGPTEIDPGDTLDSVRGSVLFSIAYISDDLVTVESDGADIPAHSSALEYGTLPSASAPRSLRMHWGRSEPYTGQAAKGTQDGLAESPIIMGALSWVEGSRAMSVAVTERGWRYVRSHSADWSIASIHAYTAPAWPDTLAREAFPDSALTYEEPRYSTQRMRTVAERQASALGPVLFSHTYHKQVADPDQTGLLGILVSSGSSGFVGLANSSASTWGASEPGLPCSAHLALPQSSSSHEASHGGAAAVVPVRVSVTYSSSSAATLRVMTSPRSFVDVALAGGGDNASSCGYLEVQRSAEDWDPTDGAPVAQVFVDSGASDVTIRSVTCTYGHLIYDTSGIIIAG